MTTSEAAVALAADLKRHGRERAEAVLTLDTAAGTVDGGVVLADGREVPKSTSAIIQPGDQVLVARRGRAEVALCAVSALGSDEPDPITVIQETVDRLLTRQYDIRKYGAAPTDATVDNIDAINAAIAAAHAAGGGEVPVPPGTWYVRPASGHRINLKSNITLRLDPNATIRIAPDTGDWWRLIGAADSTPVEHVRITGGTFDGAATTNTTGVDVGATALGSEQNFISLEYFDDVAIEDMTFTNVCGVQTIVLAGSVTADNAAVRRCRFLWQQGPTSADEYDTSAIYISVTGAMWVQDNEGYAAVGDDARGFGDLHGPSIVYTGNITDGFMTTYLTPHPSAAGDIAEDQVVAVGNTMRNANWGLQVWPFSGRTVRGVVIANNTIHLAQLSHNWAEATGIAVTEQAVTDGGVQRLVITGNVVGFETGDTRTTDKFGNAVSGHRTAGIGVGAYGAVADVLIAGNLVVDSPAHGIKVGRSGGTNSIGSFDVKGNTVVNAGRNSSFTDSYRSSIALYGTLTNGTVTANTLRDTGDPSKVGVNAVFVNGAATLTRVDVYGNPVQAVDATFVDDTGGANIATPLNDGHWLWVDATGDVRVSSGRPATDTSGAVVGGQS